MNNQESDSEKRIAEALNSTIITESIVPTTKILEVPDIQLRLIRGLGWGALNGHLWTSWKISDHLMTYGTGRIRGLTLELYILFYVILYTLFGAITGYFIASTPNSRLISAVIGILIGLWLVWVDSPNLQSPTSVVNLVAFVIIGRYVGTNIAASVNKPVVK